MTRDLAIHRAVQALAAWHERDHGERCVCSEAEQFGAQASAVVAALAVEGLIFDQYSAGGRAGTAGNRGASRRSIGLGEGCSQHDE